MVVVGLIVVIGGIGYFVRTSSLEADPATEAPAAQTGSGPQSALGDLSSFRTITQDTLNLLNSGNQSGATARVDDLESSWDNDEARLKPRNKAAWTDIDDKIDTVLRELRATHPNPDTEKSALTTLLADLN
ncbi:hypothetical protein [Saccharopolyspora sp. NPDC002376]